VERMAYAVVDIASGNILSRHHTIELAEKAFWTRYPELKKELETKPWGFPVFIPAKIEKI
jgi:hypothetical protein